jgi:hypothetical protein
VQPLFEPGAEHPPQLLPAADSLDQLLRGAGAWRRQIHRERRARVGRAERARAVGADLEARGMSDALGLQALGREPEPAARMLTFPDARSVEDLAALLTSAGER